jgi:hypothetical protein
MSLEYIRTYYGVPAKRGMRIRWEAIKGNVHFGKILSADYHLRVRFDGSKRACRIHPADPALTYLTDSNAE